MSPIRKPQFYFTAHPGDMIRGRTIRGSKIMLVATAFWDEKKSRFRIRRPPADHISGLAIDSGGFTAAQRWGKYPWRHEQYVDFVRRMSRDISLDFCVVMDYVCEREASEQAHQINLDRIKQTIKNELILRKMAPELPWLGVLQGNTLGERTLDLELRMERPEQLIAQEMGIGSICGRPPSEAKEIIRFYVERLPHARYHVFGMNIQTLDNADDVFWYVQSWDSYSWAWGRGQTRLDQAKGTLRREGETWTELTHRLARRYQEEVISPRLTAPRKLPLTLA